MAIGTADILFKLCATAGTAGNSLAQTDPNLSLGKYISTTEITAASLNNLFDDVSGAENAVSDVEYRCFFVHNAHATLPWTGLRMWMSAETAGGANIAVNMDSTGAKVLASTAEQAQLIANEDTAPTSTGTAWGSPTGSATGFLLGTLGAGSCYGIWVRRSAANSTAVNNDDVTISFQGDTAA